MRRRRVEEDAVVRDGEVVDTTEVVEERPVPPWWRAWWILFALLALVAVGVVLWLVLRDSGGDKTTMPDVVGMQQDDAVEQVRAANLEPNVEPKQSDEPQGTVVSQDPGGGTQVDEGEEVVLGVSSGGGTTTVIETVTTTDTATTSTPTSTSTSTTTSTETQTQPTQAAMPDVTTLTYPAAVDAVVGAGLLVNSIGVPSEEAQGTVVSQTPAAGTTTSSDDPVRINVALGPDAGDTTRVPDVTGPEIGDALKQCAAADVTCRIEYSTAPKPDNVGEVVDQDPAAGTSVDVLSQVTLFVGR
jgi:serine/threonine-protein kinase